MNDKERNDLEIAKQILHAGEIYLKETICATDALERKAAIFFSVFMLIATASIAISMQLFFLDNVMYAFIAFFLIFGVGLYAACYCLIGAIKPRGQYLVGNHPQNLIDHICKNKDITLYDYHISESQTYQDMIIFNSKNNHIKATFIDRGLLTTKITIALAFFVTICIVAGF